MAVLKWGRPTIWICKLVDGVIPENPTWIKIDNPVKDTTKLVPTKGTTDEAFGEGDELIDSKTSKTKFVFEFELYAKRGVEKPLEDNDGVIKDSIAVRWLPEDDTLPGKIIKKASVSMEETFDAANGEKWKYSCAALTPVDGGNAIQEYKVEKEEVK